MLPQERANMQTIMLIHLHHITEMYILHIYTYTHIPTWHEITYYRCNLISPKIGDSPCRNACTIQADAWNILDVLLDSQTVPVARVSYSESWWQRKRLTCRSLGPRRVQEAAAAWCKARDGNFHGHSNQKQKLNTGTDLFETRGFILTAGGRRCGNLCG